eukprot:jgi/Chrzof1/13060/Cz07g18120.t1
MKKERKKLVKALKTHRERLERMVQGAPGSKPAAQDLLMVLQQLNKSLEQIPREGMQKETRRVSDVIKSPMPAAVCDSDGSESSDSSDSSDSDSDEDCGSKATATLCKPAAVTTVASVAVGNGMVSTLTRPAQVALPCIQQEPQQSAPQQYTKGGRVLVCQGKDCAATGALRVLQEVSRLSAGSPDVEVIPCKCLGQCKKAPILKVKQPGMRLETHTRVDPLQLPGILDAHFQ